MTYTKRQRAILEAALTCFNEHGIEGTTIEQIREASGASVGSLYHHFGNKDRIAAALFVEGMNDHHDRLRTALTGVTSAQDGVRAMVYNYVDWVADNPEWARFVLNTRSRIVRSSAGELVVESNRRNLGHLKERIEGWIAARELRELPLECYSAIIVGPAHDYARGWLSGRNQTDIREFRSVFAEAAWRAVAPD